MGSLELASKILTRARAMAVSTALCGVRFSYIKWRKVIGITRYLPNEYEFPYGNILFLRDNDLPPFFL